jgi:uncharacterized protein (UPF0276 family)
VSKLANLPRLGVGLSAEPGSARTGIDARALDDAHPGLVHFLEYGADLERGLDDHVRGWVAAGRPATYHFLDVNLEESEDLDDRWLARTADHARQIGAAWLCGDAGLWHFGARDRGHQLLLPPILTRDSAWAVADNLRRMEEATGFAVLPENPPGAFYLGDLHILDYFAQVADRSGGGLLLDCAHLAIFQRLRGLGPTTGLDAFPLDRVVEIHVAGGSPCDLDGLEVVDDTHCPEPLPDTWAIVERVVPRAPNLRAIVYECERNPVDEVLANFQRLNQLFPSAKVAPRA